MLGDFTFPKASIETWGVTLSLVRSILLWLLGWKTTSSQSECWFLLLESEAFCLGPEPPFSAPTGSPDVPPTPGHTCSQVCCGSSQKQSLSFRSTFSLTVLFPLQRSSCTWELLIFTSSGDILLQWGVMSFNFSWASDILFFPSGLETVLWVTVNRVEVHTWWEIQYLGMYVCIYIYLSIHICVYMCICVCAYTYMYRYISIRI